MILSSFESAERVEVRVAREDVVASELREDDVFVCESAPGTGL